MAGDDSSLIGQQEDTMAEPVVVERRGHVQVITISRPEARNALDGAAARALAAAAGAPAA